MKYFRIGFQLALGWFCANLILGIFTVFAIAYTRQALGV